MQPLADLSVRQPETDQAEHLRFLVGELAGQACPGRCLGLPGELSDELPGDAGGQQRVAGRDDADRGEQVAGRGVLEQEAAGSGAQRREHVLI